MKDELGGKVVTEFVSSRPETYSYLTEVVMVKITYQKEPKSVS